MLSEEQIVKHKFEKKVLQIEWLEREQEALLTEIRNLEERPCANPSKLLPPITESESMSSSYEESC